MKELELEKYFGLWHEVARVPNAFQSDLWWLPRTSYDCTQRIYADPAEPTKILVSNEAKYRYPLKIMNKIFRSREAVCGYGYFSPPSSFKFIFDGILSAVTIVMQLILYSNKSITRPEDPNLHIKKIIKNKRGDYEYILMTAGTPGKEKLSWIMSKRHPDTFDENNIRVVKELIRECSLLGFEPKKMICHPSVECDKYE